jgi:hypothetical protein
MRVFGAIFVGLLIAVLVAGAAPPRAAACSCAMLPANVAETRARMEMYDGLQGEHALVVGTVEKMTGNDIHPAAMVRVERVYAGRVPERFEVTSSNCNGIVVPFAEGRRLVMEIRLGDDGGWEGHGCSTGIVDGAVTGHFQDGDAWADGLAQLMPGEPVSVTADNDRDWSWAVQALVVVGVATVMLGAVWVVQRRAAR